MIFDEWDTPLLKHHYFPFSNLWTNHLKNISVLTLVMFPENLSQRVFFLSSLSKNWLTPLRRALATLTPLVFTAGLNFALQEANVQTALMFEYGAWIFQLWKVLICWLWNPILTEDADRTRHEGRQRQIRHLSTKTQESGEIPTSSTSTPLCKDIFCCFSSSDAGLNVNRARWQVISPTVLSTWLSSSVGFV